MNISMLWYKFYRPGIFSHTFNNHAHKSLKLMVLKSFQMMQTYLFPLVNKVTLKKRHLKSILMQNIQILQQR